MNPREIRIEDYDFDLPTGQIPDHPLAVRDSARLLYSRPGGIQDLVFRDLPEILKPGDQLFINDTRVIPARLILQKETGGRLEIFCLGPARGDVQEGMNATGEVEWECMVGGMRKWKDSRLFATHAQDGISLRLEAERISPGGEGTQFIRFHWTPAHVTFAEVLDTLGKVPLPPYFHRDPEPQDYERYQTVFARHRGSVAAPTAALHFTPEVFSRLSSRGVAIHSLTLHVGAGTFRPVSAQTLGGHQMHAEWFSVPRSVIQALQSGGGGRRIAVGTTSMRTLESLYWLGVKIRQARPQAGEGIVLNQWEPYELPRQVTVEESMQALLDWIDHWKMNDFHAHTAMIIAPGYVFRMCDALITNFHMPKSTLTVLVAAFIGDRWKDVYSHALRSGYRFLSYGDSSLLER